MSSKAKKNNKALFAGTFEFFHQGHIDVLLEGCKIFDHVIVAVSNNPNKKSSSLNDRYARVVETINCLKLKNVSVIKNRGYGFTCAKRNGCDYLLRGIRNVKDAEWEIDLATKNYAREKKVRTIFICAKNELQDISSTKFLKNKKLES